VAQKRDIPGNPGQVATLVLHGLPGAESALHRCVCAELPVHITVPLKPEETAVEGDSAVLHAEVSKPDAPGTWFKVRASVCVCLPVFSDYSAPR